MERTDNTKSVAQHVKENYKKIALFTLIAILLMVGISAAVATVIHRRGEFCYCFRQCQKRSVRL